MTLGFMLLRDYHNYFYGKSFINYHLLPYGLTPEYYKDYVLENGKSVPIERFYLIQNSLVQAQLSLLIPLIQHLI